MTWQAEAETYLDAVRALLDANTPRFVNRVAPDPTLWRKVFEDDFVNDCAEGEFLKQNPNWGAYPYQKDWPTTDGKGRWSPQGLSVKDSLMVMHLLPGSMTSDGLPWGIAPYMKFPGETRANATALHFAARVYCPDPQPNWTPAWNMWPNARTAPTDKLVKERWPDDGELDFAEGALTGTIGHNTHYMNGADGGDQDAYDSKIPWTQWNVIEMDWTKGRVQYSVTPDGKSAKTHTVTRRVPSNPMHLVMQTEPTGAGPTTDSHLLVDWVTAWVPA